jgi:uncharacterized membrane protein
VRTLLALIATCLGGCASDESGGTVCPPDVAPLAAQIFSLTSPHSEGLALTGLNADGTVVIGNLGVSGLGGAFRWTERGGIVPLPGVTGYDYTNAVAVSADGSVVVGIAKRRGSSVGQPFRWTEHGGTVPLDFGNSQRREAWISAVSRDGLVVAGAILRSNPSEWLQPVPFRWTETTGMVALESPPGATGASATNVSADGVVVVGEWYIDSSLNPRVFRWTEATGLVHINAPAEALLHAMFVSDDGAVIAGVAGSRAEGVAFRWSERTGFTGLGPSRGFSHSRPAGMTADGSVVVGVSGRDPWFSPDSTGAFRWSESSGFAPLELLLGDAARHANQAVSVSSDGSIVLGWDRFWTDGVTDESKSEVVAWFAESCPTPVRPAWDPSERAHQPLAVSADGRTIIGSMFNATHEPAGWVARLP